VINDGKKFRKTTGLFVWCLAIVVSLSSAIYQRTTGPTHPLKGSYQIGDQTFRYRLKRNPVTTLPLAVRLQGPDTHKAHLIWREYPTERPWKTVLMEYSDGLFEAEIPVQPAAGKVEFHIQLLSDSRPVLRIPQTGQNVIARYKDDVPGWALIPHIIFMFAVMLVSNRLGLGLLFGERTRPRLIVFTFASLVIGALVFGPIVQNYAFGAYWTGWPFGTDLTDNKSAIAVLAWLIPFVFVLRKKTCQKSVFAAFLITLIVYFVPHSLLGSEYDYYKNNSVNSRPEYKKLVNQ
jgi:hypothetical protein